MVSNIDLVARLDRAESLLASARLGMSRFDASARWDPDDVLLLLKVAVGYPDASDEDALHMLGSRLRKARAGAGCGGCTAESCMGQSHPRPRPGGVAP